MRSLSSKVQLQTRIILYTYFLLCMLKNKPCEGVRNCAFILEPETWLLTGEWTQYNVILRVSSKQSNFFFGSNRNKPKLDLFRLFFGWFPETKKHFFLFVSVFRTDIESTEFSRNKPKNLQKTFSIRGSSKPLIFFLGSNRNPICFGCFSVCFFAKPKIFVLVCFGLF
jgi:hypothetical protein